jgi:hypothetical protein
MSMQISISNAIKGQPSLGGGSSFENLYSFEFDGSTDFIDCGNPTSLQITGNLALSAWIKKDASSTSSNYMIIGKDGVSGGTRSYSLLVNATTNKAQFNIWKSGSLSNVSGTTNISTGIWYHIMAVNDGSDLKIYVNGTLENTNVGGGGIIDNGTSDFEIGRRATAPATRGYWNGKLDEVAVWNSDQSSNVTTIYNSGLPNDLTSLSPISWWRMGDAATWTGKTWDLIDQGSGGNNGFSDTLPEPARQTDVPT